MKNGNGRPAAMERVLRACRDPAATEFAKAWVGLEPTFQSKKSVRKWDKLTAKPSGDDVYFHNKYMLKTERKVAKAIKKRFRAQRDAGAAYCIFDRVERSTGTDPWGMERQKLTFHWADDRDEPFVVKFGLDPETFEFAIKPVPLAWLYDDLFVQFLQEFIWNVPRELGLSCTMAHGGGQFHVSAKTFLTGSLLADDIAYKLDHPELASWIMDYPQRDDRSFRATRQRANAFRTVLEQYWDGKFHPRAIGMLTPENAYFDRGFGPAPAPQKGMMDPARGPSGSARDVFQTNFAFARAVHAQAQSIDPGYWQHAHPRDEGYRPDQVMRHSEGNLSRLEIAGELHVKSDRVLEPERVPELEAPLEVGMLTTDASWENRAQMTKTSAKDQIEATLLDIHHAQYLQAHPHVRLRTTLLQDQLLGDGEETLKRHGGARELSRLHREARTLNLEESHGRIKSDRIEPETLFWAAWRVLKPREKAAIADEAITGFIERVEQAASMDPRGDEDDPMEWHRHRVHPLLWKALNGAKGVSPKVARELTKWREGRGKYLARRPRWSNDEKHRPPWEGDQGK
jgi:hypothetical protein